jgi:ketosteroid isomerase-like protein
MKTPWQFLQIASSTRTRLLLTLAGLTLSAATPAVAFDFSGDVQALGEFHTLRMQYDDKYNANDAAALAALFTEDAVVVTPQGRFTGRQAIAQVFADEFRNQRPTIHITQGDQLNASRGQAWAVGQWWGTRQGQQGPAQVRGYWAQLFARGTDAWKIRLLIYNETPPSIQSGH